MINSMHYIKDIKGRNWGVFTVKENTISSSGRKLLNGSLNPSTSFKEIRGIFLKHEIEMSQDGDVNDTNWREVVSLKPILVNCETKQIEEVNVIFIFEDFSVSCEMT